MQTTQFRFILYERKKKISVPMKRKLIQFYIVLKQTEKTTEQLNIGNIRWLVHAFGSQEWSIGIV
jgi:hypothetical protein